MRTEIRIAGFGGQGILMCGIVIAKAASLFDHIYAVQTQSYGPEARGGASRTEVVISDDEIDYPKVESPEIFVVMSHESLLKYIDDILLGIPFADIYYLEEDIDINKDTVIDTVPNTSQKTLLNIDEDGDGKYDLKLQAGVNGYGEEVKIDRGIYIILAYAFISALIITIIVRKISI